MARIRKPVCRYCVRYNEKLYLKGLRCDSVKCPVDSKKRKIRRFSPKTSEYGLQLREKNKAKIFYGVLEMQFRKYFDMAKKRRGVTGEILFQLLERRLDNVIYRLKWVESRRMARQVINHGFIFVNGKKVDKPSFLTKPGDEISVKKDSFLEKRAYKSIEEKKNIRLWSGLKSRKGLLMQKLFAFLSGLKSLFQ